MSQSLADILRQLTAAGTLGFEGLIADLLSHLTGRQFHLAQSGTQEGRDMSSRHPSANVTAVECKRYQSNTSLDERELLGEISQVVIAIPDLDLWVLVTSRDVPSQLRESLRQATHKDGVELLIISDGDASPSSLEVLCAHAPNIVMPYVERQLPAEVSQLQQFLAGIAASPEFADRLEQLRAELVTPLLGYDNWRHKQNQWLTQCFQSRGESHAHLGQILNVADDNTRLIERRGAWQQFDAWLNDWKSRHQPIAALGQEGDGKTWAVASWIHRKIASQAQFPPVLFLSSAEIQTNDPHELLVHAVARHSPNRSQEQIKKHLERWLHNSDSDTPLFLVVLDGINERYDVQWWRTLLEKLNGMPWLTTIAVIITCRTRYWDRYFASLRSIKAIPYALLPYDDTELDAALEASRLRRSDIQSNLLDLARKPRYFDLLMKHRQRVAKSGDVTITRLIYEDWRDRLQRKRNIPLDDTSFQNLLRDLASKYRAGEQIIRERQLVDLLPLADMQMLEELRTSGVFQEHNGKYQVQEQHLVFAFALLLIEQVEEAVRTGRNVAETIADWLEPHPGMDIKAHICEAAALQALQIGNLPISAKTALLLAWITSQNVGERVEMNFDAYFPVDRQSYFELAEALWSDGTDHAWGQRILMRTFLRWIIAEQEAHLPIWQQWCERWLGFVHRFGYPFQRGRAGERAEEVQQAITERLGFELQMGDFAFADYPFTAIDNDGLLRLGRVAVALISHIAREPFIRAIAIGCVAEAVMGLPSKYNEFAWVIRTSQRPLWGKIQAEVDRLLKANNRITHQAAYRLLSFVGNMEAHQLQKTLPDDLFPPRPLAEKHKNDPCTSGLPWGRQDCQRCVSRTDLNPSLVARQIKEYCVDPDLTVPEDIGMRLAPLAETIDVQSMQIVLAYTSADHAFDQYEPALCAYVPDALADVVRRLARHITEREGMALQQLSFLLRKHSLIFTQEEHRSIYQAWEKLLESKELTDDNGEEAEMFLFPEVLKQLSAQDQLSHLLNRPVELHDRVAYEKYFQPITGWEYVWQQLATATSVKTITRLLWFISAHPASIPPLDLDTHVLPLLEHIDSFVRAMALQVIFVSKAETSLQAVTHGSWAWRSSYHNDENHWGSLILCEHGLQLPFGDVVGRVHPVYLGYAVSCRGNKSDEIAVCAEMLHHQWLVLGTEAPELPSDFPPIYLETFSTDDVTHIHRRGLAEQNNSQSVVFYSMGASWGGDIDAEEFDLRDVRGEDFQQRQRESIERVNEAIRQQVAAGNEWFAHRFTLDALDQVLRIRPDLVDRWVSSALREESGTVRRLQVGSTFYEALCEMLLQEDSERGLTLYWHLQTIPMYVFTRDSDSEIQLLDYALFRAPATAIVQQAWEQRLEQCTSDQEMLTIVIAAQAGQGQNWLQSYIDRALQSEVPLAYMRALTLLGLVVIEATAEQLSTIETQVPGTWVRKLVNTSLERWRRNAWSKHWFRQFLTAEDDIRSWAAFRLFLRCVDRRFWLWHSVMIAEIGSDNIPSNRMLFLDDNIETIGNKAKKNEENLQKQFLGHTIMGGQLWPWMR